MGALGAALGSGLISEVGKIIDDVFTSREEKDRAQERLAELLQRPDLAQIEVNKEEAKHASIFVAGWRPFIGWVCGAALAYQFIGYDLISWALAVFAPSVPLPPRVDGAELTSVVFALLGMGSLRTVEKLKGVAKGLALK